MSNTIGFDESFYLSQNPDVAAAVSRGIFTSGAQHYQLNGRFEGRNPNAFFNTSFYLGQYPDVAKAGVNPLTHFLTSGAAEGRFANATEKAAIDLNGNGGADDFNNAKYLSDYPDVAAAVTAGTFKSAYQHFVQFGQFEGRVATLANGTTITGPFSNTGVAPGTGVSTALTAGVDNLVGTNGNDTFNGVVDTVTASNNTFSVVDSINGGAGTDTLNILVSSITANTSLPLTGVTNVENFFVRNLDVDTDGAGADIAGTVTFDGALVAGEQQVWNDRSTGAVVLSNLGTGTVVGVRGDNVSTIGATTFTMATATDAVTINIDGGVKNGGGIVRNQTGEAAVTINSTGAANTAGTIDLDTAATIKSVTINATTALTASLAADYAAAATLNINGAGKVDLSGAALSANITTINATNSTGGVNVVASGTADITFTGGSGDDRISLGTSLTTADKLNGGAGRDALAIGNTTLTSDTTAELNKAINAAQNFEVVEFAATGTTGLQIAANGVSTIKEFLFSGTTTPNAGANAAAAAGANPATAAVAGGDAINVTNVAADNKFAFGAAYTGGAGGNGATDNPNGAAGGDAFELTPATNSPSDATTITLNGVTLTGGAGGNGNSGANGNGGAGGYAINAAQFETVNLVSSGATATATSTLAGGAGGTNGGAGNGVAGSAGSGILVNTNGTVNITGANDLSLSVTTVSPSSGGAVINAGTFNGKLTVVGSAGNDVITGGLKNDIITAGAGNDTINLSAGGQDKVVFSAFATNGRDTITGFTGGNVAGASDQLNVVALGDGSVASVNTAITSAAAKGAFTTDSAYVISTTGGAANLTTGGTATVSDFTNAGQVATYLSERFSVAGGETGVVVLNNTTAGANTSYVYSVNNNGDTTLAGSELTLVGVVSHNGTALTADNVVLS